MFAKTDSLFLSSSHPSHESPLEDLITEAKFLEKFSFDHKNYLTQRELELSTAIMKNEISSRSVCLLHLRLTEDFEFFESSSIHLEDMVHNIIEVPKRIIQRYSAKGAHAFTMLFHDIYRSPRIFISMLESYFSLDLTYHTIFAFSTFPAMFGFFTLDFFCEKGSQLLYPLIESPRLRILTESMLASFFMLQTRFFHFLWSSVFEIWREQTDQAQFIPTLFRQIRASVKFLSRFHIPVLRRFNEVDHKECAKFIVSTLIIQSMELHFCWGCPRISKGLLNSIIGLIREQTANISSFNVTELCSAFFDESGVIYVQPKMPDFSILPMVPLVMSDADIYTIVMIASEKPELVSDLTELKKIGRSVVENSYSPFTIEVENPIQEKRAHTKKADMSIELKAKIAQAKTAAYEIDDYMAKFSKEEIKYALEEFISTNRSHINMIEEALDIQTEIWSLKQFGSFTERSKAMLLAKYAAMDMGKSIDRSHEKDFSKFMQRVLSELPANKEIQFAWICRCLDYFVIPDDAEGIRKRFAIFHEKPLKKHYNFGERDLRCLKLASNMLSRSIEGCFSARLIAFMEFSKSINYKNGDPEQRKEEIYRYVLSSLPALHLIDTFLLFKGAIVENSEIRQKWGSATDQRFEWIYSKFYDSIKIDKELAEEFERYHIHG